MQTEHFYADVYVFGRRYRLPLFESERLSKDFARRLAGLTAQVEAGLSPDKATLLWLSQLPAAMRERLAKMGLIDPRQATAGKSLTDHLSDHIAYLVHKGNTPKYCGMVESRISRILEACQIRKMSELDAEKVQRYLSGQIASGRMSERTANHYLRHTKGFFRWLWQTDRLDKDISKYLHLRRIAHTRRRRALSTDEITCLLDWLNHQAPPREGLSGRQRAAAYKLALTTGLRAAEIRSLTVSSIDAKTSTITVLAGYTKNRKEAVLPLRADVLADLQEQARGKLPTAPLLPLPEKTAEMFQADLAGARQFWIASAPDDQSRSRSDFLKRQTADGWADFHSLRHTFATMLAGGGVHPKIAQALMRHSTITLTMDIYSHSYQAAESEALSALPDFAAKPTPKEKERI